MKKRILIPLFLVGLIFGLYGIALSGGGEGSGACPTDPLLFPQPCNGPYLRGTYTLAPDRWTCSSGSCPHLNLQMTLKLNNDEHVFSSAFAFPAYALDNNICNAPLIDLKNDAQWFPCLLNVGGIFNVPGTPVLVDFTPNCDTDTLYGDILIRVVPLGKCTK